MMLSAMNVLPHMSADHASSSVSQPLLADAEHLLAEQQKHQSPKLRQAFDDFVGQTFFSHLLKAMRQTVDRPAYVHGGQAEDIFQQQLDQLLLEKVTNTSASTFTDPMFELFMMNRK